MHSRSADEVQTASKSHDPFMRTVHTPPALSADRAGDEKARALGPLPEQEELDALLDRRTSKHTKREVRL